MDGFGGSRPLFGVQFDGFCGYFSSSGNCVRKNTQNVRGPNSFEVKTTYIFISKSGVDLALPDPCSGSN